MRFKTIIYSPPRSRKHKKKQKKKKANPRRQRKGRSPRRRSKSRSPRRRSKSRRHRNYGGVGKPKNLTRKRIQADTQPENLLRLAELAVQQQQMEDAARRARERRQRIEREQLLADLREIYSYDFDTVFSLPGV